MTTGAQEKLASPELHWFRAETKRYRDVIVIVHQFGGHHRQYKNLQKWWADQGFDSVSFDLSFQTWPPRLKRASDLEYFLAGSRHLWARQIKEVFEQIDAPILISSFSMPSVAALEAMVELPHKKFSGWISEGGPFVNSIQCFWNFFKVFSPVINPVFRIGAIGVSQLALGYYDVEKDAQVYLSELPANFPILSVRGWQDPIVAPVYIEQFFALGKHLDQIEVLALPEGQHVDGFRKNREEYLPRVEAFYRRVASLD